MSAENERENLAELADRLCAEFGYPTGGDLPDEEEPEQDESRTRLFSGLLSPEDEKSVATARRSLARIAAALETKHLKVVPEATYRALLDGAELVVRSELAGGNPVSAVMPSLVFLIALLLVEQDKALELSRRTSSLLEEEACS